MIHGFFPLVFALFIGHALADYPLQADFLARFKNRHVKVPYRGIEVANEMWAWLLVSHALIHAGVVWLLTGSIWLGVAELVVHTVIDYAKCESWITFDLDQTLHFGFKILWAAL